MATNQVFKPADHLSLVCSDPATPASGDPVRYGAVTGVALTDERADGTTTVDISQTVYDLSVKAVDGSGNSAVALGDPLFYVDADTPKLSKKSSGYFFGFATETITSGATATIRVLHAPSPGAGTLTSGGVGTSNLADGAVTAAKLSASLKKGFIPLSLAAAREIGSNDIINTAGDAGVLSSNTTPTLARVNGATDKKLRIGWAASNSDAITFDFVYPPDLDATAAVYVYVLAAMAGATDTPTLAINYFEGVGDTNAGGNTAAITGTDLDAYSRTISAANIGDYPNAASIEIVPAAHMTDALHIYGVWIEYTRA